MMAKGVILMSVSLLLLLQLHASVSQQLYIKTGDQYVELPGNFVVTSSSEADYKPEGRHILMQHLTDQEHGSQANLENGTLNFSGRSITVDYYDAVALYNLYLTQPMHQDELFSTQQDQSMCQQEITLTSVGRCVNLPGQFHACVSSASMDVDLRNGNCAD